MPGFFRAFRATTFIIAVLFLTGCSKMDFSAGGSDSGVAPAGDGTATPAVVGAAASTVMGNVTNALDRAPLAGVVVNFRLATNPNAVLHSTVSDANGAYSSGGLAAGDYLIDYLLGGFIPATDIAQTLAAGDDVTVNESLSPVLGATQLRIVLNWTSRKAGAVEDIDGYLKIPGSSTPVYFFNKVGSGANLDIDVLHWAGPETITITNLKSGTYSYYINNYDTRGDHYALGRSAARVSIYQGSSLVKTYAIPAGIGITYEVFRLVDGTITDIQRYDDSLWTAW